MISFFSDPNIWYDEWIEEAKKAGIEDVIAERTAHFDEVYGS